MPGCLYGPEGSECPKLNQTPAGCTNHAPATMMLTAGRMYHLALGLPKGFDRFGMTVKDIDAKILAHAIEVWQSVKAMLEAHPNYATIFTHAVWVHLDERGNTIVRWYSPRINYGWSTVILGDVRKHSLFALAREISVADSAGMD